LARTGRSRNIRQVGEGNRNSMVVPGQIADGRLLSCTAGGAPSNRRLKNCVLHRGPQLRAEMIHRFRGRGYELGWKATIGISSTTCRLASLPG
jgi:hypothetical protein